jgi:Glycosyl transferase family 2
MGGSDTELTVCTVAKNEGPYLLEWISYYIALGVNRITVYDNESTDGSEETLRKLANAGHIRCLSWTTPESKSPQLSAYAHYIETHRDSDEMVALIDLDEFIVVPELYSSLREYFDDKSLSAPTTGAIAINQRVFGSSGELEYRPAKVIERFHRAAEEAYVENNWFKSFSRPSLVTDIPNPHCVRLSAGNYVDSTGKVLSQEQIGDGQMPYVCQGLRVNHYILKSLGEFRAKRQRGGGAAATAQGRSQRYTNENFFFGRELALNKVDWTFPPSTLKAVAATEQRLLQPIE